MIDARIGRRSFVGGSLAACLVGCGSARRFEPCIDSADTIHASWGARVVALDDVEALEETDRFPQGVASGDARTDRVTLWTRHSAPERPIALAVWTEDQPPNAALVVAPNDGGYVHARIGGLEAGEWHRFAFVELDGGTPSARSAIGRFRTAIAIDALEPLTLGATACVSRFVSHDALARGAGLHLDLFLMLGDASYCDGAYARCEYRQAWQQTLSSEAYRALRARTSSLATWDDHEVTNDFEPVTGDPVRLRNARDAFFEHQPIRRFARDPNQIWRSARWGRTAEIFVLDCRGERQPTTIGRPDATMLSEAQLAWLLRRLRASRAVFKVLMTSVPVGDFPLLFEPKIHDRWETYAAQRERVLRAIDAMGIGGVLWIGGDFHMSSAGRVGAVDWHPGGRQLEILAGPGAQHGNPLASTLGGSQFDYADKRNNVTSIELDPQRVRARIRWHAADRVLADLTYDLRHGARLVR